MTNVLRRSQKYIYNINQSSRKMAVGISQLVGDDDSGVGKNTPASGESKRSKFSRSATTPVGSGSRARRSGSKESSASGARSGVGAARGAGGRELSKGKTAVGMGRGLFGSDSEFDELVPEDVLRDSILSGRSLGATEFRLDATEQRAVLARGLGLSVFD